MSTKDITQSRGTESGTTARSSEVVTDTNLPAQLNEREEAIVQTEKIREMTVDPERSIMHVPVDEVTTAENSEQWVLIMDHPVEDDIRFFLPKPRTGWSTEYKLVRLMDWYGINNADSRLGSGDPYKLQRQSLYIQHDDQEEEWELIRPPGQAGRLERARLWLEDRTQSLRESVPSTDRTALAMYGFIQLGIVLGALLAPLVGTEMASQVVIAIAVPAAATILGLLLTDPSQQ